jgi:hypothetical protein
MEKPKHRCCALDDNGKRCRRLATTKDDVFRTSDHAGWEWCVVYFCDVHSGSARSDWERTP